MIEEEKMFELIGRIADTGVNLALRLAKLEEKVKLLEEKEKGE